MGWLAGFSNRIKITIDTANIDSDLTHFPIPIIIGESVGQSGQDLTPIFDEIGSSYNKLAVTKDDGESQIYVEVEQWDSENEKGVLWVSKDDLVISASGSPSGSPSGINELYIYYDASAADNSDFVGDPGSRTEVWDSDFSAVYHFSEDPTDASLIDSTSNNNDGTPQGTMVSEDFVDGQIGEGWDFDGSDDYVDCGNVGIGAQPPVTHSCWIKKPSDSSVRYVTNIENNNAESGLLTKSDELCFRFKDITDAESNHNVSDNTWDFIAGVWQEDNTIDFYANGSAVNTKSASDAGKSSGGNLGIGTSIQSAPDRVFHGQLDEVRISQVARSAAWIKADYHAQTDNLLTYSQPEVQADWLSDWGQRIAIYIDHSNIDETLTYFPVPIVLGSSVGREGSDTTAIFDEIGSDYKKLAVTEDNGFTQLYVEVEQWDSVNEKAVLWVSRDGWTISPDEPTKLFLYFDSTKADNTDFVGDPGSRTEVWNSDIAAVYNMSEDPSSGGLVDSTSNNSDGSTVGSMTSDDLVEGLIGKAWDFDGGNDGVDIGQALSSTLTQYAFLVSFYPKGSSLEGFLVAFGDDGSSGVSRSMLQYKTDNHLQMFASDRGDGGSTDQNLNSSSDYPLNAWYRVVGLRDVETLKIYVDGAETDSDSSGSTIETLGTVGAFIGANEEQNGFFQGLISSVQLFSIAPSDAWIKADYHAQTDNLLTFSKVESKPEIPWLPGWASRITLTIDNTNIDSDLTHFPLPIVLGSSVGKDSQDMSIIFDELGDNPYKLAVTDDGGLSQLYVEVEQWDNANQKGVLWVSRSDWTLSSGDTTTLYLYYDPTHADNTSHVGVPGGGIGVWDSDFVAVYSLAQDPSGGSGCITDSTSNGHDGTPMGSMTSDDLVDAYIGKGLEFDGSDDGIDLPTAVNITGSNPRTIQAVCLSPSSALGDEKFIVMLGDRAVGEGFLISFDSVGLNFNCWGGGSYDDDVSYSSWDSLAHIAFVYDGTNKKCYLNSSKEVDTAISINTGSTKAAIGQSDYSSDKRVFSSRIDSIRISSVDRSDAWIKADYHAQTDNLITFSEPTSRWLHGWTQRRKLTIDNANIDSDLTHFPLPIILGSEVGASLSDVTNIFTELGSSSKKVAVTANDGISQLFVEIEQWDDTNSKGVLWVSKSDWTVFSGNKTIVYLYFDSNQDDNSSFVGDPGSRTEVWDSGFEVVYHMSQDPSGGTDCIIDSTTNENHGTPNNMESGDLVDGIIGKALDFGGTDESVTLPTVNYSGTNGEVTVSAFFYPKRTGESDPVIGEVSGDRFDLWFNTTEEFHYHYGSSVNIGTASKATETWYLLTISYDGNTVYAYLDGELFGSEADNSQIALNNGLYISGSGSNSNFVVGVIDTVKISSIARSAAWIKADYNVQIDTVISFGDTESEGVIDTIAGTVQEAGTPVARTVRVYRRSDGALIAETTSDSETGAFSVSGLSEGVEYYVVALDEGSVVGSPDLDYNALIFDGILPVEGS